MAINFNNQNQGIGTLDLSEYGLLQPQNQNMQVAGGYDTPTEGQYGFNLIELDRLKNAGYDPAEVSGYENKEDVQSLIRSLEPTSMAISNYEQLFPPRTMTDANQSLYTGLMDQSGNPILNNIDIAPFSSNTMQKQGIGIQPLLPPGVDSIDISKSQKKPFGLNTIFNLYKNYSPAGLAFRGAKAVNNYLQNTDFGRSTSLVDYLDARRYGGIDARERARSQNMREARAIQKQLDLSTAAGNYNDGQDRNRGQIQSSPKKSSPTQERHTSGSGGLHSGY